MREAIFGLMTHFMGILVGMYIVELKLYQSNDFIDMDNSIRVTRGGRDEIKH